MIACVCVCVCVCVSTVGWRIHRAVHRSCSWCAAVIVFECVEGKVKKMWDKVSSSSSRHTRVAIVDRRRPAFTPTGWHCFINKWFSMVLRLVSGKESYKKYLLFWLFWLVAGSSCLLQNS